MLLKRAVAATREEVMTAAKRKQEEDAMLLEKYARIIEELRFQNWKLQDQLDAMKKNSPMPTASNQGEDEDHSEIKSAERPSNDNRQFLEVDLKAEDKTPVIAPDQQQESEAPAASSYYQMAFGHKQPAE